MLAVVNKPRIEMCINGNFADVADLVNVLRVRYDITILSDDANVRPEDDEEETVDILSTDYWKTVTPGSLLAGTRLKHELTQQRLAILAGMSHATISAYENGKRPLSRRSAVRLAKAMGEDPDVFFRNLVREETHPHTTKRP